MKKIYFTAVLLVSVLILISVQAMNITQTIYIQPLGKVKFEYLTAVKRSLESFYKVKCVIMSPINPTEDVISKPRKRIDASMALNKYNSSNHTIIVTERDISHFKSVSQPDWGIFGLATKPGKIAIVSSYRLHNPDKQLIITRLQKIAIHELGHNLGLAHCNKDIKCLMSAAGGTIKQVDQEDIYFCTSCKRNLIHSTLLNLER